MPPAPRVLPRSNRRTTASSARRPRWRCPLSGSKTCSPGTCILRRRHSPRGLLAGPRLLPRRGSPPPRVHHPSSIRWARSPLAPSPSLLRLPSEAKTLRARRRWRSRSLTSSPRWGAHPPAFRSLESQARVVLSLLALTPWPRPGPGARVWRSPLLEKTRRSWRVRTNWRRSSSRVERGVSWPSSISSARTGRKTRGLARKH